MQVSFFSVQPHTEPFAFRILEFRFRFLDSLGFGKNILGISHEPHFLQCRVQDVGWVYHQLCRTIMCFIARGGACEKQLLSLLKKLFVGSSTTKNICEATFAHLYHMVNKQSKNWKMHDWTKYLYAILSPYVETSGMCQLLPDNDDWTTVRSNLGVDLRKTAHKFFNVNSTRCRTAKQQSCQDLKSSLIHAGAKLGRWPMRDQFLLWHIWFLIIRKTLSTFR